MALRNLKAAFGTRTSPLSVSIDDHPTWLQHQRRRDALAASQAAAADDVTRLHRERAQAEHHAREAAVRQLLDGNDLATVTVAPDARIIAADAAIAAAQVRAAMIAEALKRLDSRGSGLRNTLVLEVRDRVEAAHAGIPTRSSISGWAPRRQASWTSDAMNRNP